MEFAPFLLVRQHFPSHKLSDIPGTVREQLNAADLAAPLKPGSTVAIGVGSRGIANLSAIVGAVVSWWKDHGMNPFLFPAMGSHGAASAAGQATVLAKFGITSETMGCPVRSSLAVVNLGTTPEGINVYMDKAAHSAGGIMLVGRVKWHTDFAGKLESGLYKMMAIGIGKLTGAAQYHAFGYKLGLERVIYSVGQKVLASGRILGGLAILEDGYHDTARLQAVGVDEMEQREEELLALVKTWMPRIPVQALDVLMVNEIGKSFSGAGMDTKVVNRSTKGLYNPWPDAPLIARIFVRDLNRESYGNAIGLGMADVIHRRLLKRMKRQPTYVNALTASNPAVIRTPINFSSDRRCLETLCATVGKLDPLAVTMGWVRNSQDLTLMAFSENLRQEIEANPQLEILAPARALEFDARGDLTDWLA